jgi:hypothetical protein
MAVNNTALKTTERFVQKYSAVLSATITGLEDSGNDKYTSQHLPLQGIRPKTDHALGGNC